MSKHQILTYPTICDRVGGIEGGAVGKGAAAYRKRVRLKGFAMTENPDGETLDLALRKQVELIVAECNVERPDRILRLIGNVIKPVRQSKRSISDPNVQ